MIGAVIFVICFLAFLAITLGVPTLPPGDMIHELLSIPVIDYPVLGIPAWLLINAIVNGVVYGFVIWLVFSIVNIATKRKQKTYTCELCNMTFGTKEELEGHTKTHEAQKAKDRKQK